MSQVGLRILGLGDWTLRFIFFVLAFAVMYIVMISFYSPQPFAQVGSRVLVRQTETRDVLLLTETRVMRGFLDQAIDSVHAIYEKSNPSNKILVDGIAFESSVGEFTVVSSTVLPTRVSGVWCSQVRFRWWPSFSQREFTMNVPDVCFDVSKHLKKKEH